MHFLKLVYTQLMMFCFLFWSPNVTLTPTDSATIALISESPNEVGGSSVGDDTGSPLFHIPLDLREFFQAQMIPSNFCRGGSKLQLRPNDEDEDLAVIDQVNRRLAMGQLDPQFPWAPPQPHQVQLPLLMHSNEQGLSDDQMLGSGFHLQQHIPQPIPRQGLQQQFQQQYFFPTDPFKMDPGGATTSHPPVSLLLFILVYMFWNA